MIDCRADEAEVRVSEAASGAQRSASPGSNKKRPTSDVASEMVLQWGVLRLPVRMVGGGSYNAWAAPEQAFRARARATGRAVDLIRRSLNCPWIR